MSETNSDAIELRIATLTQEVDALRRARHEANNRENAIALSLAEIKLVLAQQDKAAADHATQFHERLEEMQREIYDYQDRPGIKTRLDRIEKAREREAQQNKAQDELDRDKTGAYRTAMLAMVGTLFAGAISAVTYWFWSGRIHP